MNFSDPSAVLLPQASALFRTQSLASPLAERVQAALRSSKFLVLRGLDVETHHNIVILSGRVNTPHERRLAVAITREVPGVGVILDRLALS